MNIKYGTHIHGKHFNIHEKNQVKFAKSRYFINFTFLKNFFGYFGCDFMGVTL